MKLKLALVCAIGLASVNAMACYTVYDRSNNVVYNSQTPPVDMSRPLSETVPAAFPGGTMVFGSSTNCPREAPVRISLPVPPSKPSPLLTDRRTAAALNAPHAILPSGVALISAPTAVMTAGLSSYSTFSPSPVSAGPVTAQRGAPRQEPPPYVIPARNGIPAQASRRRESRASVFFNALDSRLRGNDNWCGNDDSCGMTASGQFPGAGG